MRPKSIALVALMLSVSLAKSEPPYPTTGKEAKGFEALDEAVIAILRRHGIPGASLAVAKDGRLLLAKGYGWANLDTLDQVQPDTLFGVASLSKPITAAAILKLVDQGKLRLEDKPFVLLSHIRPYPGVTPDPRLKNITVRHLLQHSGGWDAKKSGDPVSWNTEVQYRRGDKKPISPEHLISFTLGVRLDFEPGTDIQYSNFGYIVLGEVIEKASGTTYEKYVKEHILKPAGIVRGSLHSLNGKYFANESRRYLAGNDQEIAPWKQKYSDAAGGWTMSAIDMVRFLTVLDGTRDKPLISPAQFDAMIATPSPPLKTRPNGSWVGLGWDVVERVDGNFGYFKDGLWFGMRTFMRRSPKGVCWALLFNASVQLDVDDNKVLAESVKRTWERFEAMKEFPDLDLFKEFKD